MREIRNLSGSELSTPALFFILADPYLPNLVEVLASQPFGYACQYSQNVRIR
jgi:hypothetical protein